ncbi:MAG: rRNA ((967)-C(5))-methyltransferase RsmB, partial [Pseudomonadota bacterium]
MRDRAQGGVGVGPSTFKAARILSPEPESCPRWSRLLCVGPVYASPALAELLAATADAVRAVRAGRSLTDALAAVPAAHRGGTQALAFTVLRRWGAAQAVRHLLAPRAPAPWVDALLSSALALADPGVPPAYPPHTLVDQAVAAARRRAPASSGFVNAVLRRALREPQAWTEAVRRDVQARWNHPVWWVDRLRADWPQQWPAMLESAQQHPPMTLRVNARQATGAQWLQRLEASGRTGRLLEGAAYGGQAIVLDTPCPVQDLPGFEPGEVSVQDASAQRAAPLLIGGGSLGAPLPRGARVLDACAAPGGKTAHLLELAELRMWALDSDAGRLKRVGQTLQRLG